MKPALSSRWKWLLRRGLLALGAVLTASLAAVLLIPFPRDLLASFPAATVLCDRDGRPLRVQLGPSDLDCRPTYRPQADDWIVQAIIAAEDQRFWSHPGLDPLALARAAKQNVMSLRRVSGGSTLSTQVIRLAEPRRRTFLAKCVEAFRALQMERALTKEEILAQYLNRAPFGANLVGIEPASRRYFGKEPAQLSLAEAALLAGLPQSPSRFRPDRNPERAKKRQAYVLERMAACGMISEAARHEALAQKLAIRPAPYPFLAPHFCDMAGRLAAEAGGSGARLQVRTTLDASLQRVAEEALKRQCDALRRDGVRGGAVVILDVKTGAVRALVGSPDFHNAKHRGQVNAALASRSAGSTLKPFVYALAFDRGLATAQEVLPDVPRAFRDYRPENFDETFHGVIPARDALILSLNMPAIAVEERVGQPLFHATLRRLGLATISKPAADYGLGLVIGNAEVRLLDLANAYACLARGGDFLPYQVLENDGDGVPSRRQPEVNGDDVPPRRQTACGQAVSNVFSAEACWLIADLLSGDERALAATGNAADVRLPRLAWKTGTSAGLRDAWTVAFNPRYVVGVWLGNPDGGASDRLVGITSAAPVVWEIFRRLYPDNTAPWFERPPGIRQREVCAVSGCPPGPHCGRRSDDWYIAGVSRFDTCAVHARGGAETWPPEVAAFLARRRDGTTGPHAPAGAAPSVPRITAPAAGSTFRLLDQVAADAQRIPFSATGGAAVRSLHWFVNDRYLGASAPGQGLLWPVERGTFQIVCCDESGGSDSVKIAVE